MQKKFLLKTETARTLYLETKALPIIDYHNHLSMEDISKNVRFYDVYDLWIKPDPYKHRAMRMCGVSEKYITGDASNEEKFIIWCETLPKLPLNPLSHWSMMELETVFGIVEIPNAENAKSIYERCNRYLETHEVTANSLLRLFNVEFACPCASLTDDLSVFAGNACVAPSLRGDDVVAPTIGFLNTLSRLAEMAISDLHDFECALERRLLEFKKVGCVFADHALDDGFAFYCNDGKNGERFQALLKGELSACEGKKLTSYILFTLGMLYAKHGFVLQLHIGAQRYTSSKLRKMVGPAGGFAGIGNTVNVRALTEFLDAVDCTEYGLPKTVLFTLNPADNAVMSVLAGSYSKNGEAGLITQGPAWWWCDHKLGMVEMFENTAVFSALSNFVGMTTDSRSFLSFVRHDYFRRILCDWLADKWENGEILCDLSNLKLLVKKLCYENAKKAVRL
ncbi:MAG: glucuronate isomerase [Clostridia bacterium]|nr:glucuronate isomerase [Clostridia bacterium]